MAEILKLGPASLHASNALTGNEAPTVYRGKNMMLRGEPGSYYFEAFGGIKNLHEPIPTIIMQGTLSFTAGNNRIEGSGTQFKDELHIGQFIYAGTDVLVVEEILTDTLFLCDRPPFQNGSNVDGYKMPILFEIDNKRGTLIWGNALKFDLGNIVCVGEGQLRLNGETLPGQSLIADRKVKLAIYDPDTENYSIERFGFHTTPRAGDVSVAVVPGGTKNATLGNYSMRWAWANKETAFGFSNPSDVIKLDSSGNSLAITASNQRFRLDFTAALSRKPSNADAVIIYRSMYSTGARSNLVSYAEGSWFVAATVQISDFLPGDLVYVDVLDEELGTEVTFDNDPPPDAEWVAALAGDLILLSCHGEKTVTNPEGTSPGPMIVPQRRGNRDAFPAETSTPLSPPDTIIGFAASVGRVFLMTRVGLPFATSTGQADFPITTRPFWQTGFKGPFGLVFINDTLYAFTSKGVTRSIATGDEGADQYAFAAAAEDITRGWYAGHVHAVHDPANELVCFIYSASHRNADGYWVSTVLPFNLRQQAFMPLIIIEKPGRDMVVCGAAKINGHLQFLAGGRGIPEVLNPGSDEPSIESGSIEPGSGSEEEGPVWRPLEGAIFVCGFECGPPELTLSQDHHIFLPGGFGENLDVIDGTSRSGRFSLRCGVGGTSGACYFPAAWINDAWNRLCGKVYVKFTTLPTSTGYIIWSGGGHGSMFGLAFHEPSGELRARSGPVPSDGENVALGAFGAPVVTDQWYRIDFKFDRYAKTWESTVTPDGNEAGAVEVDPITRPVPWYAVNSFPFPGVPSYSQQFAIGSHHSSPATGGVYFFDDIVLSSDLADYPMQEGYVHAFLPKADGNHNVIVSPRFGMPPIDGSLVGVPITNATNTAYTHLRKRPMHTGNAVSAVEDFVYAQDPFSEDDYLEFEMGPAPGLPVPTLAPRIVGTLVGLHQLANTTDWELRNLLAILDNTTLAAIYDVTTSVSNTVRYGTKFIPSPPTIPGGLWNLTGGDGNFNNLRVRFYMPGGNTPSGANSRSMLDGVVIEAEFPGPEPT